MNECIATELVVTHSRFDIAAIATRAAIKKHAVAHVSCQGTLQSRAPNPKYTTKDDAFRLLL